MLVHEEDYMLSNLEMTGWKNIYMYGIDSRSQGSWSLALGEMFWFQLFIK